MGKSKILLINTHYFVKIHFITRKNAHLKLLVVNLLSEVSDLMEIDLTDKGVSISGKKKAREGGQEQLAKAVKDGQQPDDELLEGFTDEFSKE